MSESDPNLRVYIKILFEILFMTFVVVDIVGSFVLNPIWGVVNLTVWITIIIFYFRDNRKNYTTNNPDSDKK